MQYHVEEKTGLPLLRRRRGQDLAALCAMWMDEIRPQVKPSTYSRYEAILRLHILPQLGQTRAQLITERQIAAFTDEKMQALSVKSVSDVLSVLRSALKFGEQKGLLTTPPPDITAPRPRQQEMRVLNRREQRKLEEALPTDTREGVGILLCLYTGLRLGEACALTWADVDLTEGVLTVRQTIQRLPQDGGQGKTALCVGPPKTRCSFRRIPLQPFLVKLLRPFQGRAREFVLSDCPDRPMQPRTFQNIFKRYLHRAGIADANFHALRHTFATRCVESGFDPKSLSELLGHAGVGITLNRYVHASLDWKRKQMNKLKALV